MVSGLIASTKQTPAGQKPAEGLLNGSIALFEQLGDQRRVAEARVELACSYFWQGLYDLARISARSAIPFIPADDHELLSVALIRLALIEHHAGRLHDALGLLIQAEPLVQSLRPWIKGKFHVEYATVLKDLGIAEQKRGYFERSLGNYEQALREFETLGNQRYVAIVENNWGYLLLSLERFNEAQSHLQHASRIFEEFDDQVRRAQVDETIAQLYLGSQQYDLAERDQTVEQRQRRRLVRTFIAAGARAVVANLWGFVPSRDDASRRAMPEDRPRQASERSEMAPRTGFEPATLRLTDLHRCASGSINPRLTGLSPTGPRPERARWAT
jgi:tetratricopeptide (TPR) repeat protein